MKATIHLKGGPGSGHHGHRGRPGQRGGSVPGTGGSSAPMSLEEFISKVKDGSLLINGKPLREYDQQELYKLTYGSWEEGDKLLGHIYTQQGYHAKPQLMSTDDFDDYVYENEREVYWRGTRKAPNGDENGTQFSRQFLEGDTHYPGRGIYGNGTYSAVQGINESANDARSVASSYASQGSLVRFTVRPDAKVIDYNTLSEMSEKVWDVSDDLPWSRALGDPSYVAAMMGYDAVTARSGTMMIILNRGVVVADDRTYDPYN